MTRPPGCGPAPLDLLILIGIVGLTWFLFSMAPSPGKAGRCLVYCDNTLRSNLELNRPDRVLDTVTGRRGELILQYGRGELTVLSSTCPDKICVHRGPIKRPGESAVCAPLRFMAVISGDPGDVDGLSQ